VACLTTTTVELSVTSPLVDASEAVVDVVNTNYNTSYYEAHPLAPTRLEPEGTFFQATLATSHMYQPGVSSLFGCTPDLFFDEPSPGDMMSYVVRVYDSGDHLYDCFAAGNDPVGMLEQVYPDWGNTIRPSDISPTHCTALTSAR